MTDDEYLLKICVIGSEATVKTSIIRRFAVGKFETNYLSTLGVDITTKEIEIDNNKIKLIPVDIAGQEFFGKLRPSYYRGASACMIFAQICNTSSLETVPCWLAEFRKHMTDPTIPITLLAVIPDWFAEYQKRIRKYKKFSWPREIMQYLLNTINNCKKQREKRFTNIYLRRDPAKLSDNRFFRKKGKVMAKKLGLNYCEIEVSDSKVFTECIIFLTHQVLAK